jgi:lactose/L-arabinose transport system permease protein
VLAFVLATQTISTFQLWEQVYMLTNGGPNDASGSIVFSLYQTSFQFSHWGMGAAMAVMLMLIIAAVSLFQFRYYWQEVDL